MFVNFYTSVSTSYVSSWAYQSILRTVDYFKNKKTLSNQTPNINKKEKKYHFQTTLLSQTAVQQNLIQRFCNFFCTSIITVSFFFVFSSFQFQYLFSSFVHSIPSPFLFHYRFAGSNTFFLCPNDTIAAFFFAFFS